MSTPSDPTGGGGRVVRRTRGWRSQQSLAESSGTMGAAFENDNAREERRRWRRRKWLFMAALLLVALVCLVPWGYTVGTLAVLALYVVWERLRTRLRARSKGSADAARREAEAARWGPGPGTAPRK